MCHFFFIFPPACLDSLVVSPLGNFPSLTHPVSYFFGFSEFVVVRPQEAGGKVSSETAAMAGELRRSKQLVSQLQIAANGTGFTWPVLVQGQLDGGEKQNRTFGS